MKYYSFHIGDYYTSTRQLSFEEDIIYRRLIDLYYIREKCFPSDVNDVCWLIGAKTKKYKQIVHTILHKFFEKRECGWYNSRCEEEIEKYHSNNEKRSKASKARWEGSSAQNSIDASLQSDSTVNGIQTKSTSNAHGVQVESISNAHGMLTNNHKPITNNQNIKDPPLFPKGNIPPEGNLCEDFSDFSVSEPSGFEGDDLAKSNQTEGFEEEKPVVFKGVEASQGGIASNSLRKEKRVKERRKACRIPDDFQPDLDFAVSQGLSFFDAKLEAEKMRNWSHSSPKGAKLDWAATWRNWVYRVADDRKKLIRLRQGHDPPSKREAAIREHEEFLRELDLSLDGGKDEYKNTIDLSREDYWDGKVHYIDRQENRGNEERDLLPETEQPFH